MDDALANATRDRVNGAGAANEKSVTDCDARHLSAASQPDAEMPI